MYILIYHSRITGTTVTDLNPDKYNQGLRYSTFMVKLDRDNESCNTFDDGSGRICEVNKKGDMNLNVFDVITKINATKALPKHILCKYKYKVHGVKYNSNQESQNQKKKTSCRRKRLYLESRYF